jgi:pantothenate kinase
VTLDDLARRALDLVPDGGRVILGIAGSPGSGKTALARAVTDRVNALVAATGPAASGPTAAHVPMDGFHLANSTLDALGRRERKGAIDTFDAWGYVALLRRLGIEREHTVYAPAFERIVDEPVAGSIAVAPAVRLVITEGNYLLVDAEPWSRIPSLLAASWFVATPAEVREARLVDRHTRHGRTPAAALAWSREVDGANAVVIEPTRSRASLVVEGLLPGIGV